MHNIAPLHIFHGGMFSLKSCSWSFSSPATISQNSARDAFSFCLYAKKSTMFSIPTQAHNAATLAATMGRADILKLFADLHPPCLSVRPKGVRFSLFFLLSLLSLFPHILCCFGRFDCGGSVSNSRQPLCLFHSQAKHTMIERVIKLNPDEPRKQGKLVKLIIERDPNAASFPLIDTHDKSLLLWAVRHKQHDVIKVILEQDPYRAFFPNDVRMACRM